MPSRIFRFYSLEPGEIFRMAGDRWPSAIVRRSGWKVGGSPVWYTTIVLDDETAADQFRQWLTQNAPRRDIRPYVGRSGRAQSGNAYRDVALHRGGPAARLKLALHMFRQMLTLIELRLLRLAFRRRLRFRF